MNYLDKTGLTYLWSKLKTLLNNKVDKVIGKGLSTNDYTTEDKTKLSGIATGAQVNTVTGVKGNSETSYRIGNINITKANIGLSNVTNYDQSKAIKSIARSGTTFTYTALDGTTGTFTQQDNNTTYSNFVKSGTGAKAGLVPAPSTTAGNTKYLREDGTWTTPPDTNTTYSVATTSANGLMSSTDKTKLDNVLRPYTLFENTSGTNKAITLSESATKFNEIEITYKDTNSVYNKTGIHSPNGKKINLSILRNGAVAIVFYNAVIVINGTSLTWESNKTYNLSNSSFGDGTISIVKVVGYK